MDRSDFPLLSNRPGLVYLDSAATTHKPAAVIEAVTSFVQSEYASVHRGLYPLSIQATGKFEAVRAQVAKFINAPTSSSIIFTKGATEAINSLAVTLSAAWQAGDEVILSVAEHHSNLIPWQQAAQRHGLNLKFATIDGSGRVDLSHFSSLVSNKTKAVSITHCSNVLGVFNPISDIKKILGQQGSGAYLIVDASQSIAHLPINVQDLGCDFLVCSSHKMYGPSGIGIWWGRDELLANLPPYQTGGDMVTSATLESADWNEVPWKFEAGTPNAEGVVGLGAAITYLTHVGMQNVYDHAASLSSYAMDRLSSTPGVNLVGTPEPGSGIIAFTVEGIHPHDIAEALGKEDICVRAGHHCAAPLHHHLGLQASVRASLGLYNTQQDIDRLKSVLEEVITDYANA